MTSKRRLRVLYARLAAGFLDAWYCGLFLPAELQEAECRAEIARIEGPAPIAQTETEIWLAAVARTESDAALRRADRAARKNRAEKQTQRLLLTGMDCLPGQLDMETE